MTKVSSSNTRGSRNVGLDYVTSDDSGIPELSGTGDTTFVSALNFPIDVLRPLPDPPNSSSDGTAVGTGTAVVANRLPNAFNVQSTSPRADLQ